MQTIIGRSKELSPTLECALAEYRHKIFIERMGWSLPVENGRERDQFDHPNTLYVVLRDTDDSICGCARLLPTTEPYLLSEVFPHMLGGAPVPSSHEVWELSRFAASGANPNSTIDVASNTRNLLATTVKIAAKQGAKRLIFVTHLGAERLLLRMGVHAHRAGPPTVADGARIVACWIEIDDQTLDALGIAAVETLALQDEEGTSILAATANIMSGAENLSRAVPIR